MNNGFFRAAAVVPAVRPGDVEANVASIVSLITEITRGHSADMLVFPELCITGYTCGDLFHNSTLLEAVDAALIQICTATAAADSPLVIVGAPVSVDGVLYNCAIAIRGRVLAVIPKTYIPTYNEFYERRWWAPAPDTPCVILADEEPSPLAGVPFGCGVYINYGGKVKIGVEICEDLWSAIPPGTRAALAGAQVIANLSASDDIIGKYDYLLSLISQQSARCMAGYVYSSAGYGESSTDLTFDGKAIVAEKGLILAKNTRWCQDEQYVVTDIDIEAINYDRRHNTTFSECAARQNKADSEGYVEVSCPAVDTHQPAVADDLLRTINRLPFVPSSDFRLQQRCEEVINIQVAGLCRRLQSAHCKSLVIGISGGLDSTLALLVAVRAFDKLELDRRNIHGITMPGFGTTDRTLDNAMTLMKALEISHSSISIAAAVNQHFADIGHDPAVHDVTYENSQARERTQILMDMANRVGGMVLGTGDLSELALGWATYNGDHMSMYGINASVPKTLVRCLVNYFAMSAHDKVISETLSDILDTPISPELVPAGSDGKIVQKSEDLVGPYELHDFFIYYTLRYGFTPARIFWLACRAFAEDYSPETIKHWLKIFYRRFFSQQFKRSCLPDGPKVGAVCLSPRGDWRMPSDASAALWLSQCEKL